MPHRRCCLVDQAWNLLAELRLPQTVAVFVRCVGC